MRLEVSGLLKETGQSVPIREEVNLAPLTFQGEAIDFPVPVAVAGTAINAGAYLDLQVRLDGRAGMLCGRCAERYEDSFSFDVDLRFARQPDPDQDIMDFSGEWIDLDPYFTTEIVSRLPIQRLCSRDCKGLCPVCGVNLNQASCDCIIEEDEDTQNPFQVLKDFVDDDEEV